MMKTFYLYLIIISSMVCLESKGWWAYWFTLEVNSLSFIVFLYKEKKKEAIFIFFLFQTLSSIAVMLFIFMSKWSMEQNEVSSVKYLMVMSIMMKIGMFPFHNWTMKIMKNFSWVAMMILFTWQKIIPIVIFMKMIQKSKKMLIVTLISMLLLNFIIMYSSNMKMVITISSLVHNTWMLLPLMFLKELSILYMVSYSLILIPLLFSMMKMNMSNIFQQMFFKKSSKEIKILMLSFSSIPPSVGFLMKMWVLMCIITQSKKISTIAIIIISSCVSFFVYFRMLMKYFYGEKMKNKKKSSLELKNLIKEVTWVLMGTPIIVWA